MPPSTASDDTDDGTVYYAIGDIHGRADLLGQLLLKIKQDIADHKPQKSVLICLGDYVDRGDQSFEVIDLLNGKDLPADRQVFLKGNHDHWMETFMVLPEVGKDWLTHGGMATLTSYKVRLATDLPADDALSKASQDLSAALPAPHRIFLSNLTPYLLTDDGFLFVHAGIEPGVPIENQHEHNLMWIRDAFLDDHRDHGFCIIHGHTPVPKPQIRSNRIAIDTQAWRSGHLTCAVLQRDRKPRFLHS